MAICMVSDFKTLCKFGENGNVVFWKVWMETGVVAFKTC